MIGEVASSLFHEELYTIRKKTVVVISESWENIADAERVLLQKILGAVGLTIEAVTIIQQTALSIESIRHNAARVIYFGTNAIGIPTLEATRIDDLPVIVSPTLEQLQTDASAKQKLWTGLKILFGK